MKSTVPFRLLTAIALAFAPCVPVFAGSPVLKITPGMQSNGAIELNWNTAGTGWVYAVQSAESLEDSLWLLPRAQQPWPISSRSWIDTRTPAVPARYYRVLTVPEAQRGKVLSSSLVGSLSRQQIGFLLQQAGASITPQYGVQLHRVVYETIGPNGAPIQASGAMVLPEEVGHPLPLVSYQHGTIARSNDAPSSMDVTGEITIGIAFATTGYAAALPDYLGLGDSYGIQAYQHARSEATCGVDLLRAVRSLCATNGFPLTDRLFLCGYSQGGHATMSLAREIEAYHTNEFLITACAPMAGAYDMSGVTTEDFLSGRPQPSPYYFALLLAAYQNVYHLAPTLADLFAAPFSTTLPPLLQGGATGEEINGAMPADPVQVLKPEYLAAFRQNPNHPLRQALRDNDVHVWTPRTPMRLYHCSGDQDVAFANSQVALASFQSRGATQVTLNNTVPGGTHGSCVLPSLLAAKAWFDSLR